MANFTDKWRQDAKLIQDILKVFRTLKYLTTWWWTTNPFLTIDFNKVLQFRDLDDWLSLVKYEAGSWNLPHRMSKGYARTGLQPRKTFKGSKSIC